MSLHVICMSLQVIAWNKKHSWKQAVSMTYTLGKGFLAVATFKNLLEVSSQAK